MGTLCAGLEASVKSLRLRGRAAPFTDAQDFDGFDRFRLIEGQNIARPDPLSGFIGFARLTVFGDPNAFAADIIGRDRTCFEKPCAPQPNINADAGCGVTHSLAFQPQVQGPD